MLIILIGIFFYEFQEGTNLNHYLKSFTGRTQQFILVVGGKPAQMYVVIERQAVEFTTVKSVDYLFKVFYIFDLEYPPPALGMFGRLCI